MNIPKLKDIIGWDVVNWSYALKYWEQNTTLELSDCFGLEVGSDYGGLSTWLALKGSRVIYSDRWNPTRGKGPFLHKKYGIFQLIEYKKVDVTNIQYNSFFDVIMFKSVLGGIVYNSGKEQLEKASNDVFREELQRKAIKEIYKALKPGGEFFFAENLVGSQIHMFLRNKFRKSTLGWRYLTIEEIEDFSSIFSQFALVS